VAVRRFPARRGSVGGAPAYATIAPRDSSCLFSEQRAAALAAATRSARSAPTDATCDAARVRQTRGSRLLQCAAGCSLAESCRRALDYRAKRYAIDTPRAGPSVGPLLPHPSRPRDRRSELDSVGGARGPPAGRVVWPSRIDGAVWPITGSGAISGWISPTVLPTKSQLPHATRKTKGRRTARETGEESGENRRTVIDIVLPRAVGHTLRRSPRSAA
jgi:hypothetical protein